MTVYRPRMAAVLTVPVAGTPKERLLQGEKAETLSLPVRVRRARLVSNDFNHADELHLECTGFDVGVDPRFLSSATVEFSMGNAAENGEWNPARDRRFVGIMTRPGRTVDEHGGYVVSLEFQDYTRFFLKCDRHHFPAEGIPEMGENLTEAWARICDHVGVVNGDGSVFSTVSALRDRIVYSPSITKPPVIGDSVIKRLRTSGKIQVKPGCDAWAVWQQCCGQLGLISFIRGDICFVTTATDYYTASNPPSFVWGRNILSIQDGRSEDIAQKGIGVISFDPITNTTIEAVYPPDGDQRIEPKKVAAKTAKVKPPAVVKTDRTYYDYPSVTDPERLLEIAQRIYEERSRQELEGRLVTREMSVATLSGSDFDLLELAAGDVISISAEPDTHLYISSLGSANDQEAYLIARGYSFEAARLIVRNMSSIQSLPSTYYTKTVETELSTDGDGGSFQVTAHYMNRISIDGATSG